MTKIKPRADSETRINNHKWNWKKEKKKRNQKVGAKSKIKSQVTANEVEPLLECDRWRDNQTEIGDYLKTEILAEVSGRFGTRSFAISQILITQSLIVFP